MNNKHLYIFNEADSNAGGYGVGTYINNMIDIFSNYCFDKITVVSIMTNDSIVKVINEGGIRKINIPKLTPSTASKSNYFQSIYYILYPLIEQEESLNYFHFNFFSSSKLAREIKENIKNARLLITIHYFNEYDLIETGTNTDFKNNLYDKVIVICNATKAILRHQYLVDSDKLVKIPHGIKDEYSLIDNIQKNEIIKEVGLLENNLQLLYVGRLDENKNVALLIKVFIKLCSVYNDIHLNIIGSGDFDSAFKTIESFWGKINFFGKLNKQNVYKLYQISDIGIVPSYYEELGYVVTEMMMFGLPIVANNTGGIPDIIKNEETGLLFNLSNCKNQEEALDALYHKIETLIKNVILRKKLGNNARISYLNNLSIKKYSESMVNVYKSIN